MQSSTFRNRLVRKDDPSIKAQLDSEKIKHKSDCSDETKARLEKENQQRHQALVDLANQRQAAWELACEKRRVLFEESRVRALADKAEKDAWKAEQAALKESQQNG